MDIDARAIPPAGFGPVVCHVSCSWIVGAPCHQRELKKSAAVAALLWPAAAAALEEARKTLHPAQVLVRGELLFLRRPHGFQERLVFEVPFAGAVSQRAVDGSRQDLCIPRVDRWIKGKVGVQV